MAARFNLVGYVQKIMIINDFYEEREKMFGWKTAWCMKTVKCVTLIVGSLSYPEETKKLTTVDEKGA